MNLTAITNGAEEQGGVSSIKPHDPSALWHNILALSRERAHEAWRGFTIGWDSHNSRWRTFTCKRCGGIGGRYCDRCGVSLYTPLVMLRSVRARRRVPVAAWWCELAT